MSSLAPKPKMVIDHPYIDQTTIKRWRRDVERYASLIGFRPLGIALIVLLLVAIWYGDAWSALSVQRKAHNETSAQLAQMRALNAMRTRIESGLQRAIPDYEHARQRGIQGQSFDAALVAWRGDCMAMMASQHIDDATFTQVARPKDAGGVTVAAWNVEFTAVPEQLLSLNEAIKQSGKLLRVATLDMVPDMATQPPRLHVKMRIEAPYFPPKGSGPADAEKGGAFARTDRRTKP